MEEKGVVRQLYPIDSVTGTGAIIGKKMVCDVEIPADLRKRVNEAETRNRFVNAANRQVFGELSSNIFPDSGANKRTRFSVAQSTLNPIQAIPEHKAEVLRVNFSLVKISEPSGIIASVIVADPDNPAEVYVEGKQELFLVDYEGSVVEFNRSYIEKSVENFFSTAGVVITSCFVTSESISRPFEEGLADSAKDFFRWWKDRFAGFGRWTVLLFYTVQVLLWRFFDSVDELQYKLNQWINWYNTEKKHGGYGMNNTTRRNKLISSIFNSLCMIPEKKVTLTLQAYKT